jgi:hypothetical protein
MTRTTNARIAGATFLLYIALGILAMVLFGRATDAQGIAAKLAGIAEHATEVRVVAVLNLFTSFCAFVLAVSLYAITRDEDPDLAMLGLTCRVGEGVIGALSIQWSLGLLWLATATGADAPDTPAAHALGAFLLEDSPIVSATFFAVGSTLFSWLLLRGRMIPVPLAWLGVAASVLLVILLPLQLAGFGGPGFALTWGPMAVFEVVLALWLLIKGVATPTPR